MGGMKSVAGFLASVAILAAIVLFFAWHSSPGAPEDGAGASATTTAVSAAAAFIQASTTAYAIDVAYPQFGIAAIDDQIRADVQAAAGEIMALPPNPADSAVPQSSLTGEYDKVYVGPDIISVELILSQYTGGAHPLTLLSGVAFDRATGRRLLLADVLPLIGMDVEGLSRQATARLEESLGDAFMFRDGADTNPENFSSFTVGTSTVTFVLQPYQVAAYAAGPQEIVFPRVR